MYQVWTKDEFGDTWHLIECKDKGEVKEEILAATKVGHEVLVSVPMEFSIDVKIKEPRPEYHPTVKEKYRRGVEKPKEVVEDEAAESGPTEDPGTGGPGNGPV